MKFKSGEVRAMISLLDKMIAHSRAMAAKHEDKIKKVHEKYLDSALNLIHYRTLRLYDIRELQEGLAHLGLSRLGKAEAHVMASMLMNRAILQSLIEEKKIRTDTPHVSFKKGEKLLARNAKELFGYRTKGRRVRIMVTQPSEAANNASLAENFLYAGMNTARINCAHDSPEEWHSMTEHIKTAGEKLKKKCKISMDLGGPKIRTGQILPGPKVKRLKPTKDIYGKVLSPLKVKLIPESIIEPETSPSIPLKLSFFESLKEGNSINFKDTRNKNRKLKVEVDAEGNKYCLINKTTYIQTGITISNEDIVSEIAEIPSLEQSLILFTGDFLLIKSEAILGKPAIKNESEEIVSHATISCTSKEIFSSVNEDERILFDDGKIGGIIKEVSPDHLLVLITHARDTGSSLKADKGINFPDSKLRISGLTEKDKQDLVFVAKHADIVNLSFVNKPEDVEELQNELKLLDAKDIGLILKIETQPGFNHLTEILLKAMQNYPVGVMIARGDLAIECGWDNIGRIQEEILSICQAAHIPVIWATQVLDNLAKKGIPSRAEITDATMSQRAECVMLNKGPHILSAIQLLDKILQNMKHYQLKKAPLLPVMQIGSL